MTTMTTWQQLLADQRVWLGPLGQSRAFKDFVELQVPEIIEGCADELVTFERWIHIQYLIARALADISLGEQNENIALSLSGYQDKDMFLAVRDTTEEAYALQMKGLYKSEHQQMLENGLTVGELYRKNPVAFFGPLLRKNERTVN